MKIIISPAKQMRIDTESGIDCRKPVLLADTEILLHELRKKTYTELKELWACNDKIAEENFQRLKNMNLHSGYTPAVLAYDGLQYIHMGPRVFEYSEWKYINENLRILSGFYGILRADDGIVAYRLEMQAKLQVEEYKNLYSFWQDKLCQELVREDKVILNLASKEYSKAVDPYLTDDVQFVSCIFASGSADKYKVKATEAKMARGCMVRWCAQQQITDVEMVKKFDGLGYAFCEAVSTDRVYVFLK